MRLCRLAMLQVMKFLKSQMPSMQIVLICNLKPGFHMIVTVGEVSPRQARGHIGDGCIKWKHFLNDVADQTGTVRGRIERVEMSLKPSFYMIVTEIVSICRRLIGDTSPMCCSRSPTVTIIWKQGLKLTDLILAYSCSHSSSFWN